MSSGKNPLMLMMALSMPGAAHALGLGDIHVGSGLNERLVAEIDIVGATALDLTDLRAAVANRETFLRYGADRPALSVEAPNCGLGEFHSFRADASCAPAARARPSTD